MALNRLIAIGWRRHRLALPAHRPIRWCSAAQQKTADVGAAPQPVRQHSRDLKEHRTALNLLYLKADSDPVVQTERPYVHHFVQYIERASHMDKVRKAQARVMQIKAELREAGTKKREILQQLDTVRNDLHHTYKNMKLVMRSSEKHLELAKEEYELYAKERDLQEAFTSYDNREQELFNFFSIAINDSYQKEKLHTNFVKVLGIIGTILGAFITLIVTVIGVLYNQSKFYSLRQDFENTFSDQVIKNLKELKRDLRMLEKQRSGGEDTKPKSTESWGSYLNRNTRWIYGWALPKKAP